MQWRTEIDELHAFFEGYFLGTRPIDDVRRFAAVLDPEFTIVGPDGSVSDRDATIAAVTAGHAHTTEMSIECIDHTLHLDDGGTVLASYVECHIWADGRRNERLSTVAFRHDDSKPNGLRWLRVHETWTVHD